MIFGIGIDLVEVGRIEAILNRRGEGFLRRIYTGGEIEYCSRKARPAVHYAARFAVKEAFLKAVGLGMGGTIRFSDIGTAHDGSGKPVLAPAGGAEAFLALHRIRSVHLTISHTATHATAVVVLEQ